MLTKEKQEKFVNENVNKPVMFVGNVGRFIGYIETKDRFLNVITFCFGSKRRVINIDAGLRLTFIEKDNVLFEETNDLLSKNGCPLVKDVFYEDKTNDPLFNTSGIEYLKINTERMFNKIVSIDNDFVRLVGYSEDDYGNSYIGLNINNEKKYFDSLCQITEVNLSDALKEHFECLISKSEKVIVEKYTYKDEQEE